MGGDNVSVEAGFRSTMVSRAKAVFAEKYDLTDVRIWPVSVKSARFSLPCVVEGDRDGKSVRVFAKIMGSSDHFTAVISQFIKNMYLEGKGLPAMFDVATSAHGMARHQHDRLKEYVAEGILTSRPLGFHDLDGVRAMLVMEYVVGKPFSKVKITTDLAQRAFDILRLVHEHGLSHGDIKLDNLVLGPAGQLYLLDVGSFRDGTPAQEQRAYDIASMLCALSEKMPVDELIHMGVLKYPAADQLAAVPYVELSRNRPDFCLPDDVITPIQAWLSQSANGGGKPREAHVTT
jgi:hypothetical protein